MSTGNDKDHPGGRLSRSAWAAAIIVAAAALAFLMLPLVEAFGGRLIVQEGVALAVFLVVTLAAVARTDRNAAAGAPTVGGEIATVVTVIGLACSSSAP